MDEITKSVIRRQAHELLDIALDTNGFKARQRKETGTMPTLFFDYSGHVQTIDMRISPNGWNEGEDTEELFYWRMKDPISDEKMEKIKAACKEALSEKSELEVINANIEEQSEKVKEESEKLSKLMERKAMLEKEAMENA